MLEVSQPYKVLSIELMGNHLFSVSGFNNIRVNFENILTLILGTNGCGKSTLLAEISPLPANPLHYTKEGGKANGYKYITIAAGGSTYDLRSVFKDGKGEFQFWKDGTNLNPTGMVSLYRELVYRHFGYNTDVRDVLIGKLSFTTMTVAERRKWLTYISNCDYTFALAYFRKLSEEHRDAQGAIKRMNARLLTERAKLLDPDEYAQYKRKHEELDELTKEVMSHSQVVNPKPDDVAAEFKTTNEAFVAMCREVASLSRKRATLSTVSGNLDDDQRLIDLERESAVLDSNLSGVYEKLQVTMQRIEEMESEHVSSLDDVRLKLDQLWAERSTLHTRLKLDILWEDPEVALSSLKSASVGLLEALGRISPMEGEHYTREMYDRAIASLEVLRATAATHKYEMETIDEQLKHLRSRATHDPTTCPSCNHSWIVGFSLDRMQQLELRHIELKELYERSKAEEESAVELVEKIRERLMYVRDFLHTFNPYPALFPLRNYMNERKLAVLSPDGEAPKLIYEAMDDLQVRVELQRVTRDLETLEHLRGVLELDKEKGVAAVFEEHAKLEALATSYHKRREIVSREIEAQRQWGQLRTKIRLALREIKGMRRKLEVEIPNRMSQHTRSMLCNHIVLNIEKEKGKLSEVLYKQDVQQAVISGLEQELVRLSEEESLLKKAIEALSPKEGLIAKGLTGFINRFLMRLNAFMARVWSYPIELSMLEMSDDSELDYYFPVVVDDRRNDPVPDIAHLSNGQAEVVNFAFRLVSMMCLRMSMYPIFLDEFGAKMDATHRRQAFELAVSMVEQSDFSQIFMVSHHESTYSALTDSNVVVLEPTNVILPSHFDVNRNVVLR